MKTAAAEIFFLLSKIGSVSDAKIGGRTKWGSTPLSLSLSLLFLDNTASVRPPPMQSGIKTAGAKVRRLNGEKCGKADTCIKR